MIINLGMYTAHTNVRKKSDIEAAASLQIVNKNITELNKYYFLLIRLLQYVSSIFIMDEYHAACRVVLLVVTSKIKGHEYKNSKLGRNWLNKLKLASYYLELNQYIDHLIISNWYRVSHKKRYRNPKFSSF